MSSNINVDIRAVRFSHIPNKELLKDYKCCTNIEILKKMDLEMRQRKIHPSGQYL